MGGNTMAQKLWRDYIPQTEAIVYLVDPTENNRLDITKQLLHVSDMTLLIHKNTIREAGDRPVAIVLMKSDKLFYPSLDEIVKTLNLGKFHTSASVQVFSHSNLKNKDETLAQIFNWIASRIE
jgi:GTPase SAR1 family protein